MKIKSINISNFKSFENLEVNLGDFNVLIGSNASGKTNFTQIFRFLKDIQKEDFENALSMQGGEYFRNINLKSDIFSFKIIFFIKKTEIEYYLKLRFKSENDFLIEKQNLKCLNDDSRNKSIKQQIVSLGDISAYSILTFFSDFNNIISIYDFNPKLPQNAISLTGKSDLEEDGRNLPIVIKNILENKENKKKFLNILTNLLPVVNDLDAEKFGDKYLMLKLQEKYSEEYLPAFLMSDGTITIIELIIALFFEKKPVIIIEEPERNIHPALFSKLIGLMKEASKEKQIIITTHNPEIIKHAYHEDPNSLLLISRDKRGFSQISRPADNENLKAFLSDDIGVDQLFIDDLLGI